MFEHIHHGAEIKSIGATMPKVAVMIINLNGKHHLKQCLDSLQHQTYPNYDVYLVDNGSIDGSVEYLKEKYPWTKTIVFKENLGFARGYNESLKKLYATDFAVFLNNDTEVDEKWLSELVTEITKDEKVIAVGSKILLYDHRSLLHNAGIKVSPITAGFDIGLCEDGRAFNEKRYIGATCGASMIVRKDLFLKIGGFDEDYFAYFEDVDFGWRSWLFGYKIVYAPSSVVYHKKGGSFGRKAALTLFLGERNQLLTIMKNCQLPNLLAGICFLTPLFVLRVLVYLKDGQLGKVYATCNSALWILKSLRKVLYKRQFVQKNRIISDKKLVSIGMMGSFKESIREELKLMRIRQH